MVLVQQLNGGDDVVRVGIVLEESLAFERSLVESSLFFEVGLFEERVDGIKLGLGVRAAVL